MSTLGGTKGERNAKPKFAALDINKLYITSRGESLEPSSQKSAVPRKHGMQSLGKVPTARRPPANLPSLKAEVGNPGEQSGSWTSDHNEGQNLIKSSSDLTEKITASPNPSISNINTQHQTSSLNNSKPCESSWNTNEFPSLDGTGPQCGNVSNKSQLFQDHYAGAPQSTSRNQQKGLSGRSAVSNVSKEDVDGGGGKTLGGSNNCQSTTASSQSPPLPPQFRALLPPFMQRGSDSGLAGNENEGGGPSSLPALSPVSHLSTSGIGIDSKNNNMAPSVNNSNSLDSSKVNNNSGNICSGKKSNNNDGTGNNSSSFGNLNQATNVKITNQFPLKQPSGLTIHPHQQQNARVGGVNNFSSMPTAKGGRVVRGVSGASNNSGGEGSNERGSGTAYNDNYQHANRRGGINHQPRYANRSTMGGNAGTYNSAVGHVRSSGSGNVAASGDAGSPCGFHDDNRNSHPPYGSGVLAEQEVVVRPIIRDEELQRLEAIAKDEGWAKDYEFDYNQKLEFSDDESEINSTSTAIKEKDNTMGTSAKNAMGVNDEKVTDPDKFNKHDRTQENLGVAHKDRDHTQVQESSSIQANGNSGMRGISEGSVINVNIVAGGLDAAEAKERIKQRREEDQKREIERKQAAARKLQELEAKLNRKKNDESLDGRSGNNDKNISGGINVSISSTGNVVNPLPGNRMEEEKTMESVAEHTSERIISVKIRGKSGERANVKEIRYEFGAGGLRHDREGGNLSGSTGANWDMPGFSKTFQSNLPPRFQKRKLERNTSGTNLSTTNNTTSNQTLSRNANNYTSGNTVPPVTNSGSETKSTIPFAQQYDPRFIHNQQTYGRSIAANAMSSSRRSGTTTASAPVRDREERLRQQYEMREHNQREATNEKLESVEDNNRFNVAFGGSPESSANNQAKQNTGGRMTPQLVRSLSESSNRKTSVSSDENHHNVGHHSHHTSSSTHNSGSIATMSGNYGREISWDTEVEKGSSASSPASFSGSERLLRFDCEQPKQILHRVKEVTSQISDLMKEDKMSGKRIMKNVDCASHQKSEGIERSEHSLSDSVATLQESNANNSNVVTEPDGNKVDIAAEKVSKLLQSEESSNSADVEANMKDNIESGLNECSKDTAHLDSQQSRPLSGIDDKKEIASSATVGASSQQHSGKKKAMTLIHQQHSRDNRRNDTRGGSRGSSYSGGFHRADVTGGSSTRGGTSNWNKSRGGGRVSGAGRSYNQDYWSESEFSEESFDEQSKHHMHQKIYNHSMIGSVGAQSLASADTASAASKEGFVPRGEPSRRGRGGGNVGSNLAVASSSNTNNRPKQQPTPFSGCVSSMDGTGSICKKIDGYGPPNSKSPFGGSTSNIDDRNAKHRVGDNLKSSTGAASPTKDDRGVQKSMRPISFPDATKAAEDVSSIDQEKICAIVGDGKFGAIEVHNDESHSREDNLISQKSGARSSVTDNRNAMESNDASDTINSGTMVDDTKTKTKGIITPITTISGSSIASQQSKNATTLPGAINSGNNSSLDGSFALQGNSAVANIANTRGGSNNHLLTRKQQSVSRGQVAKASNTDAISDISSGPGSNANQTLPTLMNINNSGNKTAATIATRPTNTLSLEAERSCHLQQQQSTTEKAASPINNAKTDNDKHNLDGNTPPVNTIIFENTNYKSGVSVAVLSGNSSGPVVGDCGVVGGDANITSLRRQHSVTNFVSKVNTGLINDKMATGATGAVGTMMNSQQSMTSSSSTHRPITTTTVTTANEGGQQHNIVGSSQRTALSTGVPKQQPCNMITSSLQGIPFQKTENDYKDIKSYAFETDISHLIDSDKGIKPQSSVSAGLCLSKSIEAEGGGSNHGGVAVSVKNMISPSTADLNMKIASVKKVWEMPTVAEQTGTVVNTGSGSSANRVNVGNEHSVSGGGNVPSGSNVHMKSNFVRGPHHPSHQPQYQHPHPGGTSHHTHQTHGTHSSYGAAFGTEPDSLVDHFNNSSSVCNVSGSAGSNSGCDINSTITLNNECNDSSNGGYSLSHHHSQQQPAKPHQQTHQQQQQQHHQQEMQHQRQPHNLQESSSQQQPSQQHTQQPQKQLQQHHSQHAIQQHTQQLQRQQQHKDQPQHLQQLQQLHQQSQQQQHKPQTQVQSQPQQSQSQTQAASQAQPQSQTQTSQSQSQLQTQSQPQMKTQQQQSLQQAQQLSQQLSQSQSQQHQHQQQHPSHKQSQLQQQLQQHSVQQHSQQLQQSHHQQTLQLQHQQQTQQQSQQHVTSVGVQQHQAAVAVSLGLNKHPVADVLAAAVAANNVNVCKVKPTQQNNGGGMHQSSSMGLSPPPQMQSGSIPSAPQPFFPAQYGVSAIPSPPAVLYNSPAVAAAAAMNSQGGLYNAFQIEPSGRSQFSQFPGHYGTSGTTGPYNAYMTTPTNMQAGPTPEMFQSLSSQFRMGSVQSPYNQTTQMGNPNTMLISSNNSSLMSSSVKSSTQQIGAIGQPKPNGGGSVNQPPYGQQYMNMFPPAPPLQNSAANYYSNSGGSQAAFFGTAGATGAATQNAYGIPAAAVAASNMFGSHGGQNPSNTPQPPPPQQQMPSYSSQFLNSPLLAANNPAMNQQQYRGASNNSSQHSGANAAAYIKSNQSPQSSHIQQQQQQQQQQDTWELQNQLMQHQPQISNLQQSAPPQQLPLLSTGPAGGQQNSQTNQHLSTNQHSRNVLPLNQVNNQLVGCGNISTGNGSPVVVSGGGNGNTGNNSIRGHPQAQASGVSGTRYPSPIQRPTSFTHAQSVGVQHHQQRGNRPIGYGQPNVGSNAGQQTAGSGSSSVGQGVTNSNKHFYGGNRG